MKFVYTNNKKINEMIDKQQSFTTKTIVFATFAIFSETCATICAPDLTLASCAIASTIGAGICATKVVNLDNKIKEYEKTHKLK